VRTKGDGYAIQFEHASPDRGTDVIDLMILKLDA
jgi:hypothetical protein